MPFLGRTITTNLADFHTDNYAAGSGFTAGSTTSLALSISGIDDENALRISFDGVNQHHDTWSLSSSTVTFDTAIPTGVANVEIQYGKQPTSSAFEANSVDGSHIALGSDAQGDVLYYDGSNYARLAAGTSGQFLKTQGSSANPTWATPSNSFELVSTSAASDTATISFTGVDDSADVWVIQGSGIRPATDNANLYLRHSTDGGSSYISSASAYGWIVDMGYTTTNVTTKGDGADTEIHMSGTDPGHIDNTFAGSNFNFTLYIYDPSDSNLCTTMTWIVGKAHGSTSFSSIHVMHGAASVAAAGASDAFQFLMSSGNISTGRFTLYKIKHA